jgi:hypothetical protein
MIQLTQGPEHLLKDALKAPFNCSLASLRDYGSAVDCVSSYGRELFEHLNRASDSKVAQAVADILSSDGIVYFKCSAAGWEHHAWEAIGDGTEFFVLKPNRGIARLVPPRQTVMPVAFPLKQPLRIMAVLSAAGVTGEVQWNSIFDAGRRNSDNRGLPVHIHVLTGEEELVDRIRRDSRTAPPDLTISVTPIDSSRDSRVRTEIGAFKPHILHFFCHGGIKFGVGVLRLSDTEQHRKSLGDSEFAESDAGSFSLDFPSLSHFSKVGRDQGWCWLIVLNACKLGAADASGSSFAQKLVAAGVPAAIGMTEEIDALDAAAFCRGFYPAVFAEISRVNGSLTSRSADFDWPKLLYEARMEISLNRPPATEHRHWTFPVLYLQPGGFQLQKDPADLASQMLQGWLQLQRDINLPDAVVASLRPEVIARLNRSGTSL